MRAMMLIRHGLHALSVLFASGCGLLLDFDPPDPVLAAAVDASSMDAGRVLDAAGIDGSSVDLDAASFSDAMRPDGSAAFDGSTVDLDAAFADAEVGDGGSTRDAAVLEAGMADASSTDAGLDSGTDAGPITWTCSTYPGLCVRYTHPTSAGIMSWWSTYTWDEAGTPRRTAWTADSCLGGIRIVDARTTECFFVDRPLPAGRELWFYPSLSADGRSSVCNTSGCPPRDSFSGFFAGRALAPDQLWPRSATDPALQPPYGPSIVMAYTP